MSPCEGHSYIFHEGDKKTHAWECLYVQKRGKVLEFGKSRAACGVSRSGWYLLLIGIGISA